MEILWREQGTVRSISFFWLVNLLVLFFPVWFGIKQITRQKAVLNDTTNVRILYIVSRPLSCFFLVHVPFVSGCMFVQSTAFVTYGLHSDITNEKQASSNHVHNTENSYKLFCLQRLTRSTVISQWIRNVNRTRCIWGNYLDWRTKGLCSIPTGILTKERIFVVCKLVYSKP